MKDKFRLILVNILVCLPLFFIFYVMMTTEMTLDIFMGGIILYFIVVIKATMYLHKKRYHSREDKEPAEGVI